LRWSSLQTFISKACERSSYAREELRLTVSPGYLKSRKIELYWTFIVSNLFVENRSYPYAND